MPTPPKPVAPEALVRAIDQAVTPLGAFERVSVGFPGYVRDGRVLTAPNLGTDVLAGFDLQAALVRHWGKPVRVLNDADVQGFGAIEGHGVEMVLTLGTGAGTAIFRDGEIMPHLELAHHPVSGDKTYDEYIGNAAREKKGKKAWNKRVAKVIDILRDVVRFDHLYLGGGNAKDIAFPLPPDVTIVPNTDGSDRRHQAMARGAGTSRDDRAVARRAGSSLHDLGLTLARSAAEWRPGLRRCADLGWWRS